MRAHEFIDEIEDVGPQQFPISDPRKILPHAKPFGVIGDFDLFRYDQEEDKYLILAKNGQIANYTAFMEIAPNKWMSRRSQSYDPFKGNMLTAKVLAELKAKGISLQSDIQQSADGFKVWHKHLPAIGLDPKILDRSTGKIHDRDAIPLQDLFTRQPDIRHRYCFVMETHDYYSRQNLAKVNPDFTGFRNLWYGEYNVLNEHAEFTKQPKVFVDLDGVLADFFAGYQRLNPAVDDEDSMPDGPDHTYDLMQGTDFFYRLPKYASADQLIATVLDFVPSYRILSAPLHGDFANCKQQKTRWVREYLTPQPARIIITSHKYRHAVDPNTGVPNILIDDRMKNIKPWIESGGIGIQYHAAKDDVSVVRVRLREVFDHENP